MRTLVAFSIVSLASSTALAHKRHREVFSLLAGDMVMATTGVGSPLAPVPANVPRLSASGLENSIALVTNIRNAAGVVTGYGYEAGRLDPVTARITTTWTVTLPARGTLVLSQQEDGAALFAIIGDMLARGELERTFDPPYELITTIGEGRIIAGTGDFARARGEFIERDRIYFLSLITGSLIVDDQLEVTYRGE